MFGYVKPFVPELRVRDHEFYKSVYCGLCRSMKKHTGELSRVTLSFDMTFFALVRMALAQTDIRVRRRRCFLHPLRRRPMVDDNDALSYTAQVSAVLAYYKLEDTVADEKGWKRFFARLLRPFGRLIRRRAVRTKRDIERIVSEAMRELSRLEAENCAVPDMPADVFGNMLGRLLSYGLTGAAERLAREIGLHTGRWVYLVDAIADYEDDVQSGSYNPFAAAFPDGEQFARIKDSALRGVMAMESAALARAVALIGLSDRGELHACIQNIIDDGMEHSLSFALGKEHTNGERSLQSPRR